MGVKKKQRKNHDPSAFQVLLRSKNRSEKVWGKSLLWMTHLSQTTPPNEHQLRNVRPGTLLRSLRRRERSQGSWRGCQKFPTTPQCHRWTRPSILLLPQDNCSRRSTHRSRSCVLRIPLGSRNYVSGTRQVRRVMRRRTAASSPVASMPRIRSRWEENETGEEIWE